MARPTHYQPVISRFLVCALYHEGKRRAVPMTRLIDELLEAALANTPGWEKAADQFPREKTTSTPPERGAVVSNDS